MKALVRISKAPTNPGCSRVSVGGTPAFGYYCVYRGTLAECVAAMEDATAAMRLLLNSGSEPEMDVRYGPMDKADN